MEFSNWLKNRIFNEQFHRIGKNGKRYWHRSGAAILFTDGEFILLLKRQAPSDHAGTWALPGGGSKDEETAIATAIRETKEECGIDVQGYQVQKIHTKDGHHNFYTFIYKINKKFNCKLNKEHSDYKWVKISDLDDYDLHPKLKENMSYYLKIIKNKIS